MSVVFNSHCSFTNRLLLPHTLVIGKQQNETVQLNKSAPVGHIANTLSIYPFLQLNRCMMRSCSVRSEYPQPQTTKAQQNTSIAPSNSRWRTLCRRAAERRPIHSNRPLILVERRNWRSLSRLHIFDHNMMIKSLLSSYFHFFLEFTEKMVRNESMHLPFLHTLLLPPLSQ